MRYDVLYEDSTGINTDIQMFDTEEEAEAAIDKQLEEVKEYFRGRDYDYGEFVTERGIATEIWDCAGDECASWTRLWK